MRTTKFLWLPLFWMLGSLTNVQAELDHNSPAGLMADSHDVFRPLIADPNELQFALRLVMPVLHKAEGEVSMGDYLGLYRWVLPWEGSYVQLSMGGGVFARFDMDSVKKDNEVNDFNASLPIDVRVQKWSWRLLPYHVSSHLGDDYIKRTGIEPMKYSLDSFKTFVAYEPCYALRLYGGYHYIIRNETADLGHHAIQGGTEWRSRLWADNHAQWYWATDLQSWERTHWNPTVNTQLGIHLKHLPTDRAEISPFIEFFSGHRFQGQFYNQEETHWTLGFHFTFP